MFPAASPYVIDVRTVLVSALDLGRSRSVSLSVACPGRRGAVLLVAAALVVRRDPEILEFWPCTTVCEPSPIALKRDNRLDSAMHRCLVD